MRTNEGSYNQSRIMRHLSSLVVHDSGRSDGTALTHKAIKKSPPIDRCCGYLVAPIVLNKVCRYIILFLYLLLVAGACFLATDIQIYFSDLDFVSEQS